MTKSINGKSVKIVRDQEKIVRNAIAEPGTKKPEYEDNNEQINKNDE